jgi:RNA polymerase sigma-70 factor (ECF subfamily)
MVSRTLQPVNFENLAIRPEFREDWAMVQRAIGGDADCQARLLAPYTERLYRTAVAVMRNKEDAEDAVQNGLCKAFANLANFQGRSSLSTWLTSIVKNEALMALRKKSRTEASLDELVDGQPEVLACIAVDARPNPEQAYAAKETRELIEEALRQLSPALQSVLRLRANQALSTSEVGASLGISGAAVKSRLCRARQRLAYELQSALARPSARYAPASAR